VTGSESESRVGPGYPMGEARASVPAVQRLLVACRGAVGQLHPDTPREGRIGPILEAMGRPLTPPCDPSTVFLPSLPLP